MTKPHVKQLRHAYGFDEVAIVPGDVTINPDQVDIGLKIGDVCLDIPIMASAMDGVTDVNSAVAMRKLGGLSVLNLEECKHATKIQEKYWTR
jgi:IMP dehydrogenase